MAIGVIAVIAVSLTLTFSGGGSDSASEDGGAVVIEQRAWEPTGSLADDEEFLAAAAAELDHDEPPILLWAGEAQRESDDLSEFAVFAIPRHTTVMAGDLFDIRTVGRGEDWETVEGGQHQSVGSFANTAVPLPFDDIEGQEVTDPRDTILLTREDVSSLKAFPGREVTIADRTVTIGFDDYDGPWSGPYEVTSDDGTQYTSGYLAMGLPKEDWDPEAAEHVIRSLPSDHGSLTIVGPAAPLDVDDGTATVASIAELPVNSRKEDPDSITWGAVVELPEEMVDSVTSPTIVTDREPSPHDPDAMASGAPYAVAVDEKRLGGGALILTQGLMNQDGESTVPQGRPGGVGHVYTATTTPELPVIGSSEDNGSAAILAFDEPSAAVIWADEDGDPVWSSVLRQASD